MKVAVRDLKNHLSEYLRQVEAGESIVVTSHNRPVAMLSPVLTDTSEPVSEEEAIAKLDSMPWIKKSRGKVEGTAHPIQAKPGEILSTELLDRG